MDEPLFIKDWAKVFWLAEAEKAKEIWWTRFPVARNGNSYRRLMASRDGHTAFAVFVGILRLCQRERTHGRVLVKGKPVTPLDVAAETGIPMRLVKAGIDLLKSEDVAWLIPMSKVTPDMMLDGEQPGDNRATTGQQPVRNRSAIGVKPLSEQKQQQEQKQEKRNIPALQKHGAGFDARDSSALCSLLLAVRTSGGGPVFDRKTAAAIVQRTDGDRARILWAVKRYDEDTKAGKAITNPGGWIRAIAEREDPPDGFRLELRRKEIEGLAMKDKRLEEASGGAKCG